MRLFYANATTDRATFGCRLRSPPMPLLAVLWCFASLCLYSFVATPFLTPDTVLHIFVRLNICAQMCYGHKCKVSALYGYSIYVRMIIVVLAYCLSSLVCLRVMANHIQHYNLKRLWLHCAKLSYQYRAFARILLSGHFV